LTAKTLAKQIAQFALSKKAQEIVIMDLRKVADMTDFFVVCSAESDTQVKAIADAVMDGTEEKGVAAWHKEGLSQRQWVLLDYVDVVVHIFHKEARRFYSLEKMWGDAKIEIVEDTPPPVKTPAVKAVKAKKTLKAAKPAAPKKPRAKKAVTE
jgi:ribosome-associated protein